MIFGYTVGNDVTARDLQRNDVQFTRAKGFDSFCPLGPWIETDSTPATCGCRPSSTATSKQDGPTTDMVFDVPDARSRTSPAS